MIEAQIICDSISEQNHRLTTYKLRYPRFIHSEFMTHRVISRNASSSRAVPTAKLIEEVRSDSLRAAPVFWGKNQKGMGAKEELPDDDEISFGPPGYGDRIIGSRFAAKTLWKAASGFAADMAEAMAAIGAAKEYANRGLEAYSHINVVATATEWDNFFGLRLHRDAQPEMRALAVAMWEARKASTPRLLRPGEWHLPFVGDDLVAQDYREPLYKDDAAIKVSVARCARVSYESFETGKRSTVEEDLRLYDRLVGAQPMHASPAEHQATPDEYYSLAEVEAGKTGYSPEQIRNYTSGVRKYKHSKQHGNFTGWRQYRKMLPCEAVAPIPEEFR